MRVRCRLARPSAPTFPLLRLGGVGRAHAGCAHGLRPADRRRARDGQRGDPFFSPVHQPPLVPSASSAVGVDIACRMKLTVYACFARQPHEGVVFRPLRVPLVADCYAMWRADNASQCLQRYVEIVKELSSA